MGDKNSETIIVYPFGIQKLRDVQIIIPSQSGYDHGDLKNCLQYYHYAFLASSTDLTSPMKHQTFFGRSAEDLASKLELFLDDYDPKENKNLAFNFSLPFDLVHSRERDKEIIYKCNKFNREEKEGFIAGLMKCERRLGIIGEELFEHYS